MDGIAGDKCHVKSGTHWSNRQSSGFDSPGKLRDIIVEYTWKLIKKVLTTGRLRYPMMIYINRNSVWSSPWWSHQKEIFPCYWPFLRGIHRSPVNSPIKGQWRGALVFTLICARINGWVNNRQAGDLRCHRAHYDVIVMTVYRPWCIPIGMSRNYPGSCSVTWREWGLWSMQYHDILKVVFNGQVTLNFESIAIGPFTFATCFICVCYKYPYCQCVVWIYNSGWLSTQNTVDGRIDKQIK